MNLLIPLEQLSYGCYIIVGMTIVTKIIEIIMVRTIIITILSVLLVLILIINSAL